MAVFDRYTDEAKRVVFFARFEALHRDQASISAGDLLIGLTWENGTRASNIARLKENAVELRAQLRVPHLPSTAFPYRPEKEIPLDDHAKMALAYAAMEANRSLQYWIDSDHLLRGLLRFDNPARDALRTIGIELAGVRLASGKSRLETHPAPVPKWRMIKGWVLEHKVGALTFVFLVVVFILLTLQG